MRKIFAFLFLVLLAGCAGVPIDPAGPMDMGEAFPIRNQDATWGIIINEGTVHLNVNLYDEAGRLVEQMYFAGANRFFEVNNQNAPRYLIRQLPIGNYRLEIYPFYFQTDLFNPVFGKPARYRVDLPKQTAGIFVGRNPTAYYDNGYAVGGTYRHWGWICRLNGGNVPDIPVSPIPGIKLNLVGDLFRGLAGGR